MRTNSEATPDGSVPWAQLLRARRWVDADGTQWRMRGEPLKPSAVRRQLRRDDVRVVHVYGPDPQPLTGQALEDVLERYWEFVEGRAQPFSEFKVGDFRDAERHALLVFEEFC